MAQVKPNYQGSRGHGGGWVDVYHHPDPPVGEDWSVVVPDDEIWEIKMIRATLTTDSNTAQRTVEVQVLSPDGHEILSEFFNAKAADTVSHLHSAQWGFQPADQNEDIYRAWPARLTLPPGSTVRVETENLQVGDQFTHIHFLVERFASG